MSGCFFDFSSVFNSINPHKLVNKLQTLGLNTSLCLWIMDFLTNRPHVRLGNLTSSTIILNTGAPQGCVLSPLLYSLFIYNCTPTHSSNAIIKVADDTTIVGLITNNEESAYREEDTVCMVKKMCGARKCTTLEYASMGKRLYYILSYLTILFYFSIYSV